MPNYCYYEMKVKGKKKDIKRLIDCLKTDYNYSSGEKPTHKHFFRVFEADYDEETLKSIKDGDSLYISGNCAWSVYSCMMSGEHTYYDEIKKEYPTIFMGTTLIEQSKNLEIELNSTEEGMEFEEYYYLKNGELIEEECRESHRKFRYL